MYTYRSFSGIFIRSKAQDSWDCGNSLALILGPTTAVVVFLKNIVTNEYEYSGHFI